MRRVVPRFVSRFVGKQVRDSRRRWRQGLNEGRAWFTVTMTVISMYVLWHWAFGLGTAFGVSFLVAATLAIARGHIFTHPLRLVLVAVAVVIGTLVIPSLSGDAWRAFQRGDIAAAAVLAGAVALAWLLKRRLETGRSVTGVGTRRRRRKPGGR